ncbi:LysR family transcriptional regulator [Pectobacteriaceae bacterium CE90]|nr:LysR family transcriptional regulator [Pectobacteriaceae bacterium CE90]
MGTLETFVCVFECGAFSAASKRLGISQPVISKVVMQLAATLLLRSTRGLTPAETGQQFYEHIAPAINMIREAEDRARHDAQLSGCLRICALVTFARLHIMTRLHEFMSAHPHFKVDMILDDHPIDLVAEGIDVSLRHGSCIRNGKRARNRPGASWQSMYRGDNEELVKTRQVLPCKLKPRHHWRGCFTLLSYYHRFDAVHKFINGLKSWFPVTSCNAQQVARWDR